uniref:Uncharacterized protein n=1 Tax=Rhodosorus marinus TaxID=101924 RepID=A0A7S2ZKI7_9RHOD
MVIRFLRKTPHHQRDCNATEYDFSDRWTLGVVENFRLVVLIGFSGRSLAEDHVLRGSKKGCRHPGASPSFVKRLTNRKRSPLLSLQLARRWDFCISWVGDESFRHVAEGRDGPILSFLRALPFVSRSFRSNASRLYIEPAAEHLVNCWLRFHLVMREVISYSDRDP